MALEAKRHIEGDKSFENEGQEEEDMLGGIDGESKVQQHESRN